MLEAQTVKRNTHKPSSQNEPRQLKNNGNSNHKIIQKNKKSKTAQSE